MVLFKFYHASLLLYLGLVKSEVVKIDAFPIIGACICMYIFMVALSSK